MLEPTETICERCVLSDSVPDVSIGADGVCSLCREYEGQKDTYDGYFRSEEDLLELLRTAHNPKGEYDVLLMYSGGKDSTYVLYRLLEMGQRILALTFDNGYIPAACFENIRGVCGDAGVESLIVRHERAVMDRVFANSLREQSAVCTGCFRALTARGTEVAVEKDIPIVMTGLSRGQMFHEKVHQLVSRGKTDGDEIDRWLRVFRRRYHERNDEIAQLIQDRALHDVGAFERILFVDFFRYSDVAKTEIVRLIEERAPFWRKPENVGGCSSNCMINDVGIKVFQETKGYHYYAAPVAWDVRFGHLSRAEALEELRSELDEDRVQGILKGLAL